MKQARPPLPGVVVRVDRLSAGSGCHVCANVKRAKRPAAQRYSAMASKVNRARPAPAPKSGAACPYRLDGGLFLLAGGPHRGGGGGRRGGRCGSRRRIGGHVGL